MFKKLLAVCIILGCAFVWAQTDYILQGLSAGSVQFMPPNDPVYTAGVDFGPGNRDSMSVLYWKLPPVLIPGMVCKVVVKWKFFTDHYPVFYMNYFGDWQPNAELAQSSMYGGIPSPNQEFIDSFNFVVPSPPGWYRIRFMARGWYDPVTSFYGTPSVRPNWFSEMVFHSGYPIGGITENNDKQIVKNEKLINIPNPFEKNTKIFYSLSKESNVIIRFYDSSGRLIKEVNEGNKSPGNYTYIWEGKDSNGCDLPTGNYFYTVEADGKIFINKTIRLR